MRLARQSNGYAREGLAVGGIRAAPVLKRPERWESSWFWSHGSAEQHPTNALCGLTQTNALDHVNRRLAGDSHAFSRGSRPVPGSIPQGPVALIERGLPGFFAVPGHPSVEALSQALGCSRHPALQRLQSFETLGIPALFLLFFRLVDDRCTKPDL